MVFTVYVLLLYIQDQWSTWEDFGECSVTCGEGKKSQTRKRFLPCAKIDETVIQNNVCKKTKCPGILKFIISIEKTLAYKAQIFDHNISDTQ